MPTTLLRLRADREPNHDGIKATKQSNCTITAHRNALTCIPRIKQQTTMVLMYTTLLTLRCCCCCCHAMRIPAGTNRHIPPECTGRKDGPRKSCVAQSCVYSRCLHMRPSLPQAPNHLHCYHTITDVLLARHTKEDTNSSLSTSTLKHSEVMSAHHSSKGVGSPLPTRTIAGEGVVISTTVDCVAMRGPTSRMKSTPLPARECACVSVCESKVRV